MEIMKKTSGNTSNFASIIKKIQAIFGNEDVNLVVNESDDLASLLVGLFGLALGNLSRK